jgi:hypothetical protein
MIKASGPLAHGLDTRGVRLIGSLLARAGSDCILHRIIRALPASL